jgi:hypothetical protein
MAAFSTTASAGCAWVLWFESSDWASGLQSSGTNWGVVSASSTEMACRREAEGKIKAVFGRWSKDRMEGRKDSVTTEGNYVTHQWEWPDKGTAGGHSIRYLCLPDTVDPRGPKSKAP